MKKRSLFLVALATSGALLVAATTQFTPRLVYNASASMPLGFYRIADKHDLKLGDIVALKLPAKLQKLAEKRGYIGPDIPLLKRVFALKGDEVCRQGVQVFIKGRPMATALLRDSEGRNLPHWEGCLTLKENEFFALNPDVQTSFDGRYFGVLSRDFIIGKAHLLCWFEG
ncbi:S26 family signal peptidase [Paremcibacter congregatus]|uniref:S26 family signal peptidase n=1 Tax=Paremcibacter congregatus TaxID=2043170 RepID=UPI003A911B4B